MSFYQTMSNYLLQCFVATEPRNQTTEKKQNTLRIFFSQSLIFKFITRCQTIIEIFINIQTALKVDNF